MGPLFPFRGIEGVHYDDPLAFVSHTIAYNGPELT